MGIFDKLFHRKPKNAKLAPMLNGYAPVFSQFGTNIYASDVVQQALKCIVDEMKKLTPRHVRMVNGDPIPVDDDIQAVLDDPNELMTTTEFIEKITWLLLLNSNAFIVPVYRIRRNEETGETFRKYEALYPIQPTTVNFIEDGAGTLYVQFYFTNGYQTTIPYDDIIHIKDNYSVNDYMGGDQFGQPNNEPLLKTLQLNHDLLQGIAKAMNASYAINGVVKYNSILDKDEMDNAIREFEIKLQNSESGFLPIDLKAEYVPFERKSELVDENVLKFMDDKILRNWGIPVDILRGDYSKETYESFYQKAIEHRVLSFSQAFTKHIFTRRGRSFGNRIIFYPNELIFMTVQQKLELINTLAPMGGGYVNEFRAWVGLPPLPEAEGKIYQSLNWIEANKATQYQVGKVNVNVVDESKQETISEE